MKDKILVAVDGHPHENATIDYVIDLAKKMSSRVVLLHVVTQLDVPDSYVRYAQMENIEDTVFPSLIDKAGKDVLKGYCDRIKAEGIVATCITEVGDPSDLILKVADQEKPALVVVGLVGLSRLGRLKALGSVSRRVIESTPYPVLIAK